MTENVRNRDARGLQKEQKGAAAHGDQQQGGQDDGGGDTDRPPDAEGTHDDGECGPLGGQPRRRCREKRHPPPSRRRQGRPAEHDSRQRGVGKPETHVPDMSGEQEKLYQERGRDHFRRPNPAAIKSTECPYGEHQQGTDKRRPGTGDDDIETHRGQGSQPDGPEPQKEAENAAHRHGDDSQVETGKRQQMHTPGAAEVPDQGGTRVCSPAEYQCGEIGCRFRTETDQGFLEAADDPVPVFVCPPEPARGFPVFHPETGWILRRGAAGGESAACLDNAARGQPVNAAGAVKNHRT